MFDILERIEGTSGRLDKQELIKGLDDVGKKVLWYVYNPYITFGIGEKSLSTPPTNGACFVDKSLLDILDYLSKNNTGSKGVTQRVVNYIASKSSIHRKWITRIILKDLKIGVGVKTINKVFPNLVPEHNIQLLSKYDDNKEVLVGSDISISTKYDGIHATIIPGKLGESPIIISRQGQIISGLLEITDDILWLKHNCPMICDNVLEGELLRFTTEDIDSKDLYRKTMSVVSSKNPNKRGVVFKIFDIVSRKAFNHGIDNIPYALRYAKLESIEKYLMRTSVLTIIKPLYRGKFDPDIIKHYRDEAKYDKLEGIVINKLNAPYECKRVKHTLKAKVTEDCDLRIESMEEGTGKYIGKLGNLIVKYKDNHVSVGSGFTDKERQTMWEHPDLYIGKIAKISHCGETRSIKSGLPSLRHPVFEYIRYDKDEESLN